MRDARLRVASALFAVSSVSTANTAQAQVITEFRSGITSGAFGANPFGITAGPDGNVWFTEEGFVTRIGRITPTGVITEFTGMTGASLEHIAAGPDGNLWFTEQIGDKIGRITPLGILTEFSVGGTSGGAGPWGITAGPDGNLWFTEANANRVGRMTPLGGVTHFGAGITPGAGLTGITAGPDGNLWFTETNANRIGRITALGSVTEFAVLSAFASPAFITAGPDGNLWFAEGNDRIGRITPLGTVTEFSVGITAGSTPTGIAVGPDGNLWFTEKTGPRIARITPLGVVTEFSTGMTAGSIPMEITAGPDGNLWFTEFIGDRIGRITTGPGAAATSLFPLPPCRVLDTRGPIGPLGGPSLQPAGTPDRAFTVAGTCGIPADAVAISVNMTVTDVAAGGFLSIYRGDGVPTATYSISFGTGQTRANNGILQLALDGSGSVKVQNSAPGTLDFILDVSGFLR